MTSDIDIGGVKPLVTRTEIHCGRPGNTRINAGKPTYKSQEEQYQEIQELRRNLGELREEHAGLKTRNRRLEEDLIRRDRQIEQLMDPAKNDEARRKLTDKGASLVSSLKLRVSRLEATLKDKEAELAKLQASAKATALNEMKIEAETYYQEVVRLRNQLNIAQHQQQQQHQQFQQYQKPQQQYSPQHSQQFVQPPPPQPSQLQAPPAQDSKTLNIGHWSNMRSGRESRDGVRGRRDGGDGQESPSTSLRHALVHLEEENKRLGDQVTTLTTENSKLASDMERVLGLSDDMKNNYEGMSRGELIREIERGHEETNRLEAQHSQLTEAISRRNDMAGENSAVLQAKVSELQGREVEWERERSSLRELISTLKEDRMFYKETAQKKDSELDSLRAEVQNLQQEVISLHDAQRQRSERPTPPTSHRSARGSARPGPSSVSRSGSSSDNNLPTRRPRPSSARPPPAASRLQRSQKASSEPRDVPPNGSRRTSLQQSPRKVPTSSRSSSKPPSTGSSPSKTSVSNVASSGSNARISGSSSNRKLVSSSSSQKGSQYASPKHTSGVVRSASVSSSSKTPTPSSSPRKTGVPTMSPQRSIPSSASPQRKAGSSSSVGRVPTSRSLSRTPTPSSTASSPNKSATPNRSPSKVPVGRISASPAASPIKKGKLREESASPSRTPKSSRQGSLQDSSAHADVRSRRHVTTAVGSKSDPLRQEYCTHQIPVHSVPKQHQPHQPYAHAHNADVIAKKADVIANKADVIAKKEEDERVLAEILFHRETDSSGEASDVAAPNLARQRTITLSSQDEAGSGQEAEVPAEQCSGSGSLQRQNTVTLSSKSEDDDEVAPEKESSLELDAEGGEKGEVAVAQRSTESQENSESEVSKASAESEVSKASAEATSVECEKEIIENLETLQSLLSSHLSRQREVNELLSQEPLLVGEQQEMPGSSERNAREAPDGEEATRASASSKRSQNMVRQGTFNVHGEETVATIHATLDAHLTRVNKVHQFSAN